MANSSTLSTNGAKKIKILRIITRMNIGGPAVQIIGLMNNIDKERFDQRLVIGECLGNELDILNQGDYGFNPIRIKHLGRKISPLSDLKALILIIIEIIKRKGMRKITSKIIIFLLIIISNTLIELRRFFS